MSARHLVALLTLATLAAAPARGQILYSYGGPPGDGPVGPSGNLIEGANGVLYGTAYGMPNDLTLPSAYSLTPTPGASTYTVSILHTGDELGGRLLLAPAGGLYGFGHSATGAYFYILTPPPPSQTD